MHIETITPFLIRYTHQCANRKKGRYERQGEMDRFNGDVLGGVGVFDSSARRA
jgi:hypothetical protein